TFLNEKFSYKIAITGHTDNEGSSNYNKKLSQNRSNKVANYLEKNGFLKSQFLIVSKGFFEPKTTNDTEDGKAENRRVKLVFTKINILPKTIGNHKLKEDFYKIDTSNEEVIKYKSGSVITIPKNAFVDKNGNPITGKVDISYIEYRDPIDIVLSDISMNHNENGENVHFNSAGMNKILAFQNGKPVYLKKDSNITIDFPLAKDLPNINFYKYDSISRNWIEIKKLTATSSPQVDWSDSSSNKGLDTLVREQTYNYNLCAKDTCSQLMALKIVGTKFATTKESILSKYNSEVNYKKEKDSINNKKVKKRYDNFKENIKMYEKKIASTTSKINSFTTRIENSNPKYSVKIIPNENAKMIFNIKFKVKNNAENIDYTNSNWQTNSREDYIKINNSEDKIFTFCELKPTSENQYAITLKDSTDEIKLLNITLINLVNNETNSLSKVKNMNASYSVQIKRIKKLTGLKNKLLVKNQLSQNKIDYYNGLIKAIDSTTTFPFRENLYCFWNNSKQFMTEKETELSIEDWLNYFEKNKTEMQTRYEAITFDEECQKQIAENERLRIIQNEKQEKISTAYTNASEVTKSLNISQLGIYNCDQISRLQNPLIVDAEYLNEKGENINPIFIYLVDKRLNGILKYDGNYGYSPKHFAYSESSENTLLAFDENGNSYIINSTDFVEMTTQKENKNVTFFMKKIGINKSKSDVMYLF
ncbi:OmpA family protein, partial [Flavobacterium sp.]|uniref:OmpA family protein n=1 Tax=Flavobacterium sp. TaxID=239 RepID=UPI003750322E